MSRSGSVARGTKAMSADFIRNSSYTALLLEYLPLFMLAFTILMLKGIKSVKAGYLGTSLLNRVVNVVFTSVCGALLSVSCAILLPLVYPNANEAAIVGITVFMTVGGVRVIDGLAFKHLGIHLVDSSELNPAESEWLLLTGDERRKCMELWRRHKEGELN